MQDNKRFKRMVAGLAAASLVVVGAIAAHAGQTPAQRCAVPENKTALTGPPASRVGPGDRDIEGAQAIESVCAEAGPCGRKQHGMRRM